MIKSIEKKGQFFLIAAIVIVIITASLVLIRNYSKTPELEKQIYDLSNEINFEASQVLFNGVYSGSSETDISDNTKQLLAFYAKTNPNTDIAVFYGDESKINAIIYDSNDCNNVQPSPEITGNTITGRASHTSCDDWGGDCLSSCGPDDITLPDGDSQCSPDGKVCCAVGAFSCSNAGYTCRDSCGIGETTYSDGNSECSGTSKECCAPSASSECADASGTCTSSCSPNDIYYPDGDAECTNDNECCILGANACSAPGYTCKSSCDSNDITYPEGDSECSPSSQVCCFEDGAEGTQSCSGNGGTCKPNCNNTDAHFAAYDGDCSPSEICCYSISSTSSSKGKKCSDSGIADMNGDKFINQIDIDFIKNKINCKTSESADCKKADIDKNGVVTSKDEQTASAYRGCTVPLNSQNSQNKPAPTETAQEQYEMGTFIGLSPDDEGVSKINDLSKGDEAEIEKISDREDPDVDIVTIRLVDIKYLASRTSPIDDDPVESPYIEEEGLSPPSDEEIEPAAEEEGLAPPSDEEIEPAAEEEGLSPPTDEETPRVSPPTDEIELKEAVIEITSGPKKKIGKIKEYSRETIGNYEVGVTSLDDENDIDISIITTEKLEETANNIVSLSPGRACFEVPDTTLKPEEDSLSGRQIAELEPILEGTAGDKTVSLKFGDTEKKFKIREGQNFFLVVKKETDGQRIIASSE
jgi:hypothetical protein